MDVDQTSPMSTPRRVVDVSLGNWISERLLDNDPNSGVAVGSVVPTGFDQVVRVLHPAGDGRSWAEVARANNKTMHPLVQWGSIAPHFDGSGRSGAVDPEEGSIPETTLAAIFQLCPADGEVLFGVWEGYGSWTNQQDGHVLATGSYGRSYRLFTADKSAHTRWPGMDPWWPNSANLIWPRDHSWCIATEIDWDSTLIACTRHVATAILTDESLETFTVGYDDDLSWYGDTINPHPAWLPGRSEH